MAEEMGRVVLIGRVGSGRSTLANMLVSGQLKDCPSAPMDTTRICKTYVGRGWTVIDTVGFGEPLSGTVSDAAARILVIDFLKDVKGRYSHIIFVQEKGRFDRVTTIIWETFRQIFTGGEKNFVVLLTKVDDPSWLDKNRADIEKEFPGCKQFLCVNFPGIDTDPEIEELNAKTRQEELERLEKQMKDMFKASPRVEPDIYWMGDELIERKAVGILQRISSGKMKMTKELFQTEPIYEYIAAIQTLINESNTLKEKLKKISRIQIKMQNLWDKVKVHRRQCEYLLQRSLGASTQIRVLCNGNEFNWKQYLAPLISSLNSFVCSMKAGKELLRLCGDHTEQEVSLTLSSPAPYRDSFSKFSLVLRDLDWSLDVFRFLLHNPTAGSAPYGGDRQLWLSKFSWCEESCRLVWVGDGENKPVADADLVMSCLQADKDRHARDREELVSYLDSVLDAQISRSGSPLLLRCWSFQNGRSKLEDFRYGSFLKNRLLGASYFSDPSGIPGCFWISEKLEHTIIDHIGGGSFKTVHKCKWLGKEVAIATFNGRGEPSRKNLEAEAGILARVQHPNVVSFIGYTYDEEKQQGFLVTELMEIDLRTLIDRLRLQRHCSGAPFTLPVSIDILLQIVEGMIHVHKCRVVHRDLKAQNCLVNHKFKGDGYVVKLIDFGESKLRSSETGSYFNTRNKGSRAWMAPEVYGDAIEDYKWSADVYSFGMTCYEILTGELPFGTLRGRALLEEVCAGHRPGIPDDCPNGLGELMTKCWAQNPNDRPIFKEVRQILWKFKLYYTIWGTQ